MAWLLTVLLFFVPLLEILILSLASTGSGLISILILCVVTGAAGLWLMREEDFSIIMLILQEHRNQRLPTEELLDATLIWVSGVLLLVPGLITDACGITLVLPSIRESAVAYLRDAFKQSLSS
jgi:UPF0716 protein FxsA